MDFKKIILIGLTLSFFNISAQAREEVLRNYFNSIVILKDSVTRVEVYKNKKYELHLKDPITGKVFPLKNPVSGSGFIVNKYHDNYLITAEHVARQLSDSTKIVLQGKSGNRKEFKLTDLKIQNKSWTYHHIADVAVLPINLKDSLGNFREDLEIIPLDYWDINRTKKAPGRFQDLFVIGFPLGLGESPNLTSPITKKVKAASDLLILGRFDNRVENYFYLLDDPSVSGFSGGPIISMVEPLMSKDNKAYLPGPMNILGLVHGTISDPVDKAGRFAAIVPGFNITETIDKIPSFNGEYTYKYPDGSIWSKRLYKNGSPWTVISNFDKNGKPQEMGTLKSGNGTLYIYDKESKLIYVEYFENGLRTGLTPVFTEEELKNFRG